ncbi:hypothetical protein C7441_110203 [Pseudaminobacter salicylatoxidans]|uniref:Uncharacterized protein n=1 Tax=Pseudaminobacter salicylatoxidans TaxID=93369 RepID=A0A316C0X0_PSESE|nr:hypothetical protein [Pseudaminobacter salicylatoxidans]PWJ81666.1 hypothetical protein C7441_110203 [Pseudaminobacter salicylatoxidans]
MTGEITEAPFPAQLLNWAGNRSGGVRRLFDAGSGRPGQAVFETNLLHRLEAWARSIASESNGVPRILLLVGGPGNGKTEAIESTVGWLDTALGAEGELAAKLKKSFFPPEGTAVPRLVRVDTLGLGGRSRRLGLSIVQDASAVVGATGKQAAQLLLDELDAVQAAGAEEAYLCCVNRGVLDDALIEAIDHEREGPRHLLEAVTRAVSLTPDAPSCWPLAGFADVAVWPMDAESLLLRPVAGGEEPARSLFRTALDAEKWPAAGSCAGGTSCPFCGSRERLAHGRAETSLLQILRWFEVASGKRWSFRDMFSLASYLFAGHRVSPREASLEPCEWAGKLFGLDEIARRSGKPSREQSTAIFHLVASQYQHALFHRWERDAGPALLREIKELGLEDDNTAMGLQWFLSSRRTAYLPAMISSALDGVAELLDPALTDPDTEVQVTKNTRFALRELDVRFSRSVLEGLDYIRKLQVLSRLEVDLIERLAKLDAELSLGGVRRKRPASATNVQRFLRDFACRLVRRALGARTGAVLDAPILNDFQRVVEDTAGDDLFDVAQEVEQLLNRNQDFEISLTTTFGQPLPPMIRRATLVVPSRSVQPHDSKKAGRPVSPICFLMVGDGRSGQPIALTYDLFKAVKELEKGMSVASLPRTVLALLDTTRARLSGPIVRDKLVLDRARIRIGSSGMSVVQRRSGFAVRKEGGGR